MDIKITGLDQLTRKLDRLAKAASSEESARRWRAMTCPTHHKAPENVQVTGDQVTAQFCCEAFRASALAATTAAINAAAR